MAESYIPNAPHYLLSFDDRGAPKNVADIEAFVKAVNANATDVFVFSHGWNNDAAEAARLYKGFFGALGQALNGRELQGIRLSTAGVFWPSKMWADDQLPSGIGGPAAVATTVSMQDGDLVRDLKSAFPADAGETLDQLAALLDEKPRDEQQLARFHKLMIRLNAAGPGNPGKEDDGEAGMLLEEPVPQFRRFSALAPQHFVGGAAGLGDVFGGLWNGAKQALRMFTFWQMKKRAAVVGEQGLGPVLLRLANSSPHPRVHLLGHSFGARLVAYSLRGIPADVRTPVKSLMLLQGAFSHFAFAPALPHEPTRGGALAGLQTRVDGPVLATASRFDTAVGTAYPLACMASRDDAAALSDEMYKFGGMGHDGAQAVGAAKVPIGPVGSTLDFAASKFVNLQCDSVIRRGSPPSGAHSDIVHVELGWAAACAAHIVSV